MDFLFQLTPLKYMVAPLWRDEAFSVMLATQNWLSILSITARDFNPPLYYLVLKVWIMVLGQSEIALRSLSLIFFLGTVYIVDHIFEEIFKLPFLKRLPYLLLIILNPLLLYYGFEGRMYSMSAFFATASFYALYTKKKRLYFWATVLGLYTHYLMFFVIASQWFYLKFVERSKDRLSWIYKSVLWFVPWLIFLLIMKPASSTDFWIEPVKLSQLFVLPGVLYTGYERSFDFLQRSASQDPTILVQFSIAVLVAVGYAYYVRTKKTKNSLLWYLLIWAFAGPLLVFVISFVKPIYYPRYLIYATVGLSLLLCYTLEKIPFIVRIIVFILLLHFSWSYQSLQIAHREKKYPAVKIQEIKKIMGPTDMLYVTNVLDYFVAQYYIGRDKVALYGLTYNEIPSYVGKALIPPEVLQKPLPYYPKRAFILKDNGTYEIQSL